MNTGNVFFVRYAGFENSTQVISNHTDRHVKQVRNFMFANPQVAVNQPGFNNKFLMAGFFDFYISSVHGDCALIIIQIQLYGIVDFEGLLVSTHWN